LKGLAKENPDVWGEGRTGRIAVHSIVAAAGAALGGGNVAAAITGTIAGDLTAAAAKDAIDNAMQGLPPAIQREVANLVLNVLASSAGALTGGLSGAAGAAVADGYNRQLHPEERDLAKSIAARAKEEGLSYTVDQIEAQMRRMNVALPDGESYVGGPAVVIGNEGIFDTGANFAEVGRTKDGEPIMMEFGSPELGRQIQSFIVSHASGGTVPSGFSYTAEPERSNSLAGSGWPLQERSPMAQYCVTAHCAAGLQRDMTAADLRDKRNKNADILAYIGQATGRFGAAAGTLGAAPSPYAGVFKTAAFGSDFTGWLAGGVEQSMGPSSNTYVKAAAIDYGVKAVSDVAPLASSIFNVIGDYLKLKYAN